MFHFSKRAFAVVLYFCAPGVLPLTITGPTSAQSSGSITFTWTSVSTDPPFFEIDIDVQLNSLKQTDPYRIFNGVVTADGSVTFTLPALSVGTHRVAFSNTNGSVILTTGSIEILAAASSPIPSSSGAVSITSTSAPVSSDQVSSSIPSSSGAVSSTVSSTSTSVAVSSDPASSKSTSIPATSSGLQSGPTPSQTGAPQNGAITLHTNAGAIAGVVGSTVTILLALLG
ncbi:hypothetical protein B0H13DRAFT_2320631 [Mycena leptocephala]|nr:hypothetical protein B0H13DRAFT_2320631 [Mycena leptocephala]